MKLRQGFISSQFAPDNLILLQSSQFIKGCGVWFLSMSGLSSPDSREINAKILLQPHRILCHSKMHPPRNSSSARVCSEQCRWECKGHQDRYGPTENSESSEAIPLTQIWFLNTPSTSIDSLNLWSIMKHKVWFPEWWLLIFYLKGYILVEMVIDW